MYNGSKRYGTPSKKILENFNLMNLDLLTVDQLRNRVEKTWIEHIKLCQDNFMYFVREVWPEFIHRKATKPSEWGVVLCLCLKIKHNVERATCNVATLVATFCLVILV